MKSVLISIRPEWIEKIASGEKTIEVRKTAPKEVPFKAYIYCTKDKPYLYRIDDDNNFELTNTLRPKPYEYVKDYNEQNGKVIGEFICNEVEEFHEWELSPQGKFADFERERLENFLTVACLSGKEVVRYRENLPYFQPLYGWHISDLKIYDKPKELFEFGRKCDYASEIHCRDCLILGDWDSCCGVMCKPLTRPPQSYMFVEEVGE